MSSKLQTGGPLASWQFFIPRCHCHLWGARLANDIFLLFPFGILPKAPKVNQRNVFFLNVMIYIWDFRCIYCICTYIYILYMYIYVHICIVQFIYYDIYRYCILYAIHRVHRGPDLFVASRHSSYMAPRVAAQVVQRAREPFATAEEKALGQQVTRELLGWLRSWGRFGWSLGYIYAM